MISKQPLSRNCVKGGEMKLSPDFATRSVASLKRHKDAFKVTKTITNFRKKTNLYESITIDL